MGMNKGRESTLTFPSPVLIKTSTAYTSCTSNSAFSWSFLKLSVNISQRKTKNNLLFQFSKCHLVVWFQHRKSNFIHFYYMNTCETSLRAYNIQLRLTVRRDGDMVYVTYRYNVHFL